MHSFAFVWRRLSCFFVLIIAAGTAAAQEWTFAEGAADGWQLTNAKVLSGKGAGLHLSGAADPYLTFEFGSEVSLPAGAKIVVKLSANAGKIAQLFWGGGFAEADSLRAPVIADGELHDVVFTVPKQLDIERIRLDPIEGAGDIHIASIVVPMIRFALEIPTGPFAKSPQSTMLKSGPLCLIVDPTRWATFDIKVFDAKDREILAGTSFPNDVLGLANERIDMSTATCTWDSPSGKQTATLKDGEGATWTFTLAYEVIAKPGAIAVTFTAHCDQSREVTRLPIVGVIAGNGSFGAKKHQALFAGCEWLVDDEVSSNELDIRGAKSKRLVPDPIKITFPLMTIQTDGVYLGLMWPGERAAALFDSPMRVFTGKGHALVLSKPAVGDGLKENSLFASKPMLVKAGETITAKATVIGGPASDATAAVKQYIALQGVPKPPELGRDDEASFDLFIDGYTASAGAHDGLTNHAVWGNSFPPSPAADVAEFLAWIGTQTKQEAAAKRAGEGIVKSLSKVTDGDYLAHSVSHIPPPSAHLLFGHVELSLKNLRLGAVEFLKKMSPDGTFVYSGDLSKGHFDNQADGFASSNVLPILNAARLLGDDDLIAGGLKGLDALAKFDGHVPRGAQTWEIPLHTPDIMGAGRAIEALLMGYEISGKKEYLERAVYWAWTGIPFVYLQNPVPGAPIGLYATTAVYGGTHWGEPYWIGQPVQWCGLTYSYPLFQLAEYDPSGPWRRIAEGITISGMQQQWPKGHPAVGLFPDYFHLYEQTRDGPQINPGAVLANYIRMSGRPPLNTFTREAKSGVFINAPAKVADAVGSDKDCSFKTVDVPWKDAYFLDLARVRSVKSVSVDGQDCQAAADIDAAAAPAWKYDAEGKRLIVKIAGAAAIKVAME